MKISVEEVSRVMAIPAQERKRIAVTPSEPSSRTLPNREAARVDVSETAQEVQKVKRLISQLPDVREERVQALKAQIENGTYHVSGEDIADLMIRRTLADNTAL